MDPIHMYQLGALILDDRRAWAAQYRLTRAIRRAHGGDRPLVDTAGRLLVRAGVWLERFAKPDPRQSWSTTVDPRGRIT